MSEAEHDAKVPEAAIPQHVVEHYVRRFPHLATLAAQIGHRVIGDRAARSFAQACCSLQAPRSVTLMEVWHLAGVAEGGKWPQPAS